MEYVFTELGYFTEGTAKKIKEVMDGYTFMHFKVHYSNWAGNCTLIVDTDYEATEEEIKNFFIAAAFNRMTDKIKEATS